MVVCHISMKQCDVCRLGDQSCNGMQKLLACFSTVFAWCIRLWISGRYQVQSTTGVGHRFKSKHLSPSPHDPTSKRPDPVRLVQGVNHD